MTRSLGGYSFHPERGHHPCSFGHPRPQRPFPVDRCYPLTPWSRCCSLTFGASTTLISWEWLPPPTPDETSLVIWQAGWCFLARRRAGGVRERFLVEGGGVAMLGRRRTVLRDSESTMIPELSDFLCWVNLS